MSLRPVLCAALFAAFAVHAAEPFACTDLDKAVAQRAELKPKLAELDPAEGEEFWNHYIGDDLLGAETLGAYCAYLFLDNDATACTADDPLVTVINAVAAWDKKQIDAEAFATAVLNDDMGPLAFFAVNTAAKGGKDKLSSDMVKHFESMDLTLTVIGRVFGAVGEDTPKSAALVGAIMSYASMDYFDFVADKALALLADRPQLIAAHLDTWTQDGDFFAGALALRASPEQFATIKTYWNAQPDGAAKTLVLGWFKTAEEYEG